MFHRCTVRALSVERHDSMPLKYALSFLWFVLVVYGRRVATEWPESQSYCLVMECTRCSMVSADGRVRRDGDDGVNGNEISGHWDYDHRANRGQSD